MHIIMCMFADYAMKNCRLTIDQGVSFWTAGHRVDVGSNEKFEWRMNNEILPVTFTNWNAGEPNNMNSVQEHCIQLLDNFGYEWNDQPCSTKSCFVCEIP